MIEDGYLALMVAIFYPEEIDADTAFELLFRDPGVVTPKIETLCRLRECGWSYQRIGDWCGRNVGTVYRRIQRQGQKGKIDPEVE